MGHREGMGPRARSNEERRGATQNGSVNPERELLLAEERSRATMTRAHRCRRGCDWAEKPRQAGGSGDDRRSWRILEAWQGMANQRWGHGARDVPCQGTRGGPASTQRNRRTRDRDGISMQSQASITGRRSWYRQAAGSSGRDRREVRFVVVGETRGCMSLAIRRAEGRSHDLLIR